MCIRDSFWVEPDKIALRRRPGFGDHDKKKQHKKEQHKPRFRNVFLYNCSSMKLPLELYGTDEQAAQGAWVLLAAKIAPLQDAPVADPKVGKGITPQCLPYRQCASTCLLFFWVL